MFVNVAPAVPDLYSKYLGFALPICSTSTLVVDRFVPLTAFTFLYNCNSLNASVSPDTVPISGVPCTFVTSTKLPIANLVVEFCIVSKSLAFSIVTNFCPVVSIS